MRIIILLISFSNLILYSQINSFHSQQNIKLFADFLFCEEDYLRSIEEYNRLTEETFSDTVIFKLGFSNFKLGEYSLSEKYFNQIDNFSSLRKFAIDYNSANFFLTKNFSDLKKNVNDGNIASKKLLITALLLYENKIPSENDIELFNNDEKRFINNLTKKIKYPDNLSPELAGVLSIFPGLGKVYTKNYTDGLTSFILTSLFTFLAYDNFRNNNQFRSYFFSFTAAGFYLGNIWGSVVSAQKYNRLTTEKNFSDTYDFLKQKKYFIEDVKFCK